LDDVVRFDVLLRKLERRYKRQEESRVEIQKIQLDPKIQESLVLKGDLSGLDSNQKKEYYLYRCRQIDLDPAAKPFDLLTLNGKEVLYANANATQQLCNKHKLSTQITHREKVDDIYIVSVRCTGADGRVSENQGAVSIAGMAGEKLANAILKATTKAIRRTVLSHCGLGMLDETEVDTIPNAAKSVMDIPPPPPLKIEPVQPTEGMNKPWKVFIPGKEEAYSEWATAGNWVTGFWDAVDRLTKSQKVKGEEKMELFKKMIELNIETSNSLEGKDYAEYEGIVKRTQEGLARYVNNMERI